MQKREANQLGASGQKLLNFLEGREGGVGGDVGTEENFNDCDSRNGVNPGNFILSCKQGAANTGAFNNLTSYQGVLQLQWSNQPNERGNYNVFVQGG